MDELASYINVEEGAGRVLGNQSLYKNLLQTFVRNTYMEQLEKELGQEDFEAAAKTAHTIKGVSANLSLVKVNDVVVRLESQLKTGTCNKETYIELENAVKKTLEFIGQL